MVCCVLLVFGSGAESRNFLEHQNPLERFSCFTVTERSLKADEIINEIIFLIHNREDTVWLPFGYASTRLCPQLRFGLKFTNTTSA